jgi:hypothetical protein
MAKIEIFTAELFCPSCGTTGLAQYEESGEPRYFGKLDRVILSVSEGFKVGGFLNGNQQIVCVGCRGLVPV